jgi:hypothetical protein
MDTKNYIDIPFKPKGRGLDGLDCWGLVRLIYKDQYNIVLPSFSEEYDWDDNSRIQELVAQYKEGWEQLDIPQPGNIVLFRILGEETHVGVVLENQQFIHTRPGSNCVIDSLTSIKWKNRIIGYYKYIENTGVVLNSAPHPLKTQRFTDVIPEGTNLEQVYELLNTKYEISSELKKTVTIMVNGIPIPRQLWGVTSLQKTDTVEYRAVAGKEAIKMVALVVIAIYAPTLIAGLETALGMSGLTVAGANLSGAIGMSSLTVVGQIAAAATIMAGSYLINAIAPVRPPSTEDPGSPEQQYLLQGGNNPYNPYGSIPVVLGRVRMTPPMGAKSFVTYPAERESYLNMLLVWGYGPLTIDMNSVKIGEVDWDEYNYNTSMPLGGRVTFDRKTTVTAEMQSDFDKIYGNDVTQFYPGIQLSGPPTNGVDTPVGGEPVSFINISGTPVQFNSLTGNLLILPNELIPDVIPTVDPY